MLEIKIKDDLKEIVTLLTKMDKTGLTIMTSNATVLLARQEAEKSKMLTDNILIENKGEKKDLG